MWCRIWFLSHRCCLFRRERLLFWYLILMCHRHQTLKRTWNFSPGIAESWKSFFFHKFWIWRMSWFGVQTCELQWNWPKVEALKISRRTFVKWKQKIVVPCLSVISWTMHVCGWPKLLKHLGLWRIIVLKLKQYSLWCLAEKLAGYFLTESGRKLSGFFTLGRMEREVPGWYTEFPEGRLLVCRSSSKQAHRFGRSLFRSVSGLWLVDQFSYLSRWFFSLGLLFL